jgi:putative transposase
MSAPLSKDLRKRILAAKEEGASHAKIAREMRVSVSAITRLLALYRETGSLDARPRKAGRKPRLDEQMLQKIAERIKAQPDITLRGLIEEFSLPVSAQALCNTINQKLGLCRKRNGARSRTAASRGGGATRQVEGRTGRA